MILDASATIISMPLRNPLDESESSRGRSESKNIDFPGHIEGRHEQFDSGLLQSRMPKVTKFGRWLFRCLAP